MSETCRVSFQNEIEKLVHIVGLITRMDMYVGSTGRANLDDESWEELHTFQISVFQ
jgi:hypothetical protein